jgi:hypothetical protein
VRDPRRCTVCRECVRREHWAGRVDIQRVANHFIFTVESTGALTARELVVDALRILAGKAADILRDIGEGAAADIPVISEAAAKSRMLSTMRSGGEDDE